MRITTTTAAWVIGELSHPVRTLSEPVDDYYDGCTEDDDYDYNKEEEEIAMNTNNLYNDTNKTNFLLERLQSEFYHKRDKLYNQFNVGKKTGPQSASQLIDAIKKGEFKFTKEYTRYKEDNEGKEPEFGSILGWIDWTGSFPNQPDRDGYAKAVDAMEDYHRDCRDKIAVLSPENALAVLEDFKSWKYEN